jgi:hypothetical protein
MPPQVRLLVVLVSGVVWTLLGLVTGSDILFLAGLIAIASLLLMIWVLWEPLRQVVPWLGGEKPCNGSVVWRATESEDVLVGTCTECNRWTLKVRGIEVANGRGLDSFIEEASEVAQRYERMVPQIAGELRAVIAQLEERETSSPEEGLGVGPSS